MKESRLAARACRTPNCKRDGKRTQTRHSSGLCEQCRKPAKVENTMASVEREKAMYPSVEQLRASKLTRAQAQHLDTEEPDGTTSST